MSGIVGLTLNGHWREVQRRRYKIFIETRGLSALAYKDGIDAEAFDA
ncbi:hypothetical protein [Noviherbaspirillum autotrophicum]|nr:hypothetical protein [Noviherbaspirillum autotrophicum]